MEGSELNKMFGPLGDWKKTLEWKQKHKIAGKRKRLQRARLGTDPITAEEADFV